MDEIVKIILAAIVGGLAGSILTLIAIRWSTLKSIKAAEKGLRTQLIYEDKKKALTELFRLANQEYKTYPEFKAKVSSFLEGLESEFLPAELKSAIRTKFYELDKFMEDSGLAPPPPSDEELKSWLEGYEESFKELPYWEKVEAQFEERLRAIKSSIKRLISQHIKP